MALSNQPFSGSAISHITLSDSEIQYLCQNMRNAVFLDSSVDITKGRYQILSGCPTECVKFTSPSEQDISSKTISKTVSSLRAKNERAIETETTNENLISNLPFLSGLLGYASYDIGKDLIGVSNKSTEDCTNSELFVGYFHWSYVFDKKFNRGYLYFAFQCPQDIKDEVLGLLEKAKNFSTQAISPPLSFSNLQNMEDYERQFQKVKSYLLAGDCYQVNLAQPFEADLSGASNNDSRCVDIYFEVRKHVNSPYSAYFRISDEHEILSWSPEQFIGIKNGQVVSQPIKGTIENNPQENNVQILLSSEKDKAENLMIVDLIRNDLSRFCELNSVKVEKLYKLESYRNVHHLVSKVVGKLKSDISEFDAFLSCFPGGSITGAPKKRAMEIIEELEHSNRGAYCGSIFYWDDRGNFESNILIRTMERTGESIRCWGGGGIVVDSKCASEYQESITKIKNLIS